MASSIDFENVLNFRDVGKTVNEFLGVRTEHINKAEKRETQAGIPALVKENAALVEPMYIPGLDYQEIKITGRPLEKFWLSQLGWWEFTRFLFLFLFGYRMQAIRIIGTQVMVPRGLVGLGLDTLDNSGVEIRETLSFYANKTALPSVVHCTQGKDRTGLVCALVLMILGVPVPAIEYDYGLTDAALIPEREQRLIETSQIGLTEEWVSTAKDMIVRIEQHLKDKYGGLDNYLDSIGFTASDRTLVREALLY
ncbi:hypothetical protein AK830_g4903 [Neonectria ditissima]|uniref:Tyrosine specific protein phosphatases domain-containing protein n=1 Tax=Neonectria ditissima TaxID=78410 RepID=A0A0P7AUV4_9HYPO|nr:hypothetical protein AK830_g4903 [Neonectria ditissima]